MVKFWNFITLEYIEKLVALKNLGKNLKTI